MTLGCFSARWSLTRAETRSMGRLLLGLGLAEARFEDIGHAREAELAQGVIEFDEVHTGSPVWRSMRSR